MYQSKQKKQTPIHYIYKDLLLLFGCAESQHAVSAKIKPR